MYEDRNRVQPLEVKAVTNRLQCCHLNKNPRTFISTTFCREQVDLLPLFVDRLEPFISGLFELCNLLWKGLPAISRPSGLLLLSVLLDEGLHGDLHLQVTGFHLIGELDDIEIIELLHDEAWISEEVLLPL